MARTKQKQRLIQVQWVAKSIEKELEHNQYEKDRKSTGSSKASRKQPPPPPPPPPPKINEEYSQLYGIHETDKNLEEIRKQRKQARMDLENNSNDEAARAVIENTKAYIAALYGIDAEEMAEEIRKQRTPAFLGLSNGKNQDEAAYDAVIDSINEVMIKGNDESWTMFKDKKKCSMTTITQQAQIEQEQELQEDYNNIKKINIKNNNNNVFNELITYYNGGSDLKQKKINEYFS
ncbi:hypothetical protein FRACYDRAFT_249039 [Fragilariopsis cylindrus CCMP1102]|uniref:Uncharacterized protein n=1 Tax=Fragilariopsis cylindrus CCMP1102 TaxID=635003 RepID=A0A1E7ETF9_9STRA|nr:hypothetical protein FRACYDRAFT_249039 [Fragilariopsis cylindrus CCMP1102]|eukprot:OEU09126.1 hypothetical protein FRACYDRAFT_249039 [Fragilariopsis cylindrus CCMP1102]